MDTHSAVALLAKLKYTFQVHPVLQCNLIEDIEVNQDGTVHHSLIVSVTQSANITAGLFQDQDILQSLNQELACINTVLFHQALARAVSIQAKCHSTVAQVGV